MNFENYVPDVTPISGNTPWPETLQSQFDFQVFQHKLSHQEQQMYPRFINGHDVDKKKIFPNLSWYTKPSTTFSSDVSANFPQKLYNLLMSGTNGIVEWTPSGTAFRVSDHRRFTDEVIPKYFKHNNFTSFQRQLNLYGFRRMNRTYEDKGAYFHPYFLKHRPDLLTEVKRCVGAKKADISGKSSNTPEVLSGPSGFDFLISPRSSSTPFESAVGQGAYWVEQQSPTHANNIVSTDSTNSIDSDRNNVNQTTRSTVETLCLPIDAEQVDTRLSPIAITINEISTPQPLIEPISEEIAGRDTNPDLELGVTLDPDTEAFFSLGQDCDLEFWGLHEEERGCSSAVFDQPVHSMQPSNAQVQIAANPDQNHEPRTPDNSQAMNSPRFGHFVRPHSSGHNGTLPFNYTPIRDTTFQVPTYTSNMNMTGMKGFNVDVNMAMRMSAMEPIFLNRTVLFGYPSQTQCYAQQQFYQYALAVEATAQTKLCTQYMEMCSHSSNTEAESFRKRSRCDNHYDDCPGSSKIFVSST